MFVFSWTHNFFLFFICIKVWEPINRATSGREARKPEATFPCHYFSPLLSSRGHSMVMPSMSSFSSGIILLLWFTKTKTTSVTCCPAAYMIWSPLVCVRACISLMVPKGILWLQLLYCVLLISTFIQTAHPNCSAVEGDALSRRLTWGSTTEDPCLVSQKWEKEDKSKLHLDWRMAALGNRLCRT